MTADPANGGIRREPELPEHEEIAPPDQPALGEFDILDDEPDLDAAKAAVFASRSHRSPGRRRWTRPMASNCED
jgi:hypothetical protein